MTASATCQSTRRDTRRAGFSLIELMLAVTIVGLLAGIAIPNLRSMTFRARAVEVAAEIEAIRVATLSYNADVFGWPAESAAGAVPSELTAGSDPYLEPGTSFQGNGYELDYDYLSPVVIPGEPGTTQLVAVAVQLDSDELSNAVLDLLGSTIVLSLGRRHTVLIDRS